MKTRLSGKTLRVRLKALINLFEISALPTLFALGFTGCGYRAPLTAETYDPSLHPDHVVDIASEDSVVDLYQIMKDTHEVFKKCGLSYWGEGGTMLGAVRNQGIIPWDDDNDTSISSKDVNQFLLLRPIFSQLGYFIEKVFFGHRIVKNGTQAAVDIFVMKEEDGKFVYAGGDWGARTTVDSDTGKSKIEGIYLTREEIYPLKEVAFGPTHVMIPGNAKPYLDTMFKGWTNIAFTYGHAGQRKFKIDLDKYGEFKRPAPLDKKTFQTIDVTGKMKSRVPADLVCPVLDTRPRLPFPTFYDGV